MSADNRFVAFTKVPKITDPTKNKNLLYDFSRNLNAYTGEYYTPDTYSFLVLERNSAKQFSNEKNVFLGLNNAEATPFDKWGDEEEFARITGGIG